MSEPITKEMMELYVSILEKHVQQMSTVVSHLEQLDDKLTKIEQHFNNGFRSDIMEHGSDLAKELSQKIEDLTNQISANKGVVKDQIIALSVNNEKQITALSTAYDMKTIDLKASLRIDRAINIVGWCALIATLVAKLFGKG